MPNPQRAAEQFASVMLGTTLDRVMLEGEQSVPSDVELQRAADDAATVSLAAYAAR